MYNMFMFPWFPCMFVLFSVFIFIFNFPLSYTVLHKIRMYSDLARDMKIEVLGRGRKWNHSLSFKVVKFIFVSMSVWQPSLCDLWSWLDTVPPPLLLALVSILLERPIESLTSHWLKCLWCFQFKNCNTHINNSSKQLDIVEYIRAKISLPFLTSLENHHHFLEILSGLHVVHGTLNFLAFCQFCHSK